MLETTMNAEARITVPMITGWSCCTTDCTASCAEAGQPEDVLGDDRAAEHRAEVDAELRDGRRERAAQGVPVGHAPLAHALRARGADVVLAEHVEHRAARQARVGRGGHERERQPGQHEVLRPLDRILRQRHVAAAREQVARRRA